MQVSKEAYHKVKETYHTHKRDLRMAGCMPVVCLYAKVSKETYNMAKETYNMAKETYNMAKETYNMAKETYNMAKETYNMAKEAYEHWHTSGMLGY